MTAEDRFWSKVDKTASCWLWSASCNSDGYGVFHPGPRQARAHRYAYELLVGPIPDGMVLDHVRARGCTNRHCVNPAHLEPVTPAENIRRGDTGAQERQKTRCPAGHRYDETNTSWWRNKRRCRTCHRDCERARRAAA